MKNAYIDKIRDEIEDSASYHCKRSAYALVDKEMDKFNKKARTRSSKDSIQFLTDERNRLLREIQTAEVLPMRQRPGATKQQSLRRMFEHNMYRGKYIVAISKIWLQHHIPPESGWCVSASDQEDVDVFTDLYDCVDKLTRISRYQLRVGL